MPTIHSDRLERVIVAPNLSIADLMPVLERSGQGILLVCSSDRQLIGTITDGDIRRAILAGIRFDLPCHTIANTSPLVVRFPTTAAEALYQMDHGKSFVVDQLPVVAADGRVMDLILRSDLVRQDLLPMSAVIMAGGSGTRLRPLTEDTPKPLLPIGDRPLMERMIGQLRQAGIRQVNVTTHYLSEKIIEHFGNGDAFGVELSYVTEDQPLGTAGSLAKLSKARAPLLVINGDILTRVDFRAMLAFHQLHQADMTVGVRQFDFQLPYGVVDSDGVNVLAIREKPVSSVMTNAGIYLLEPSVTERIPTDRRYDMTDLIEQLIAQGRSVIMFPIVEYWLDIGQMADYEQAQEDFRNGKLEL